MTAALRQTIVLSLSLLSLSLLSLACQPSTPPPAASQDVPPPVAATPTPKTDTPAPAPEQPTPTAAQIWRFTSLVTGAAQGFDNLLGANGYYELELAGDTATLRKIGQKGTPRLPDAEILVGTATLGNADNKQWPAATRRTLDVELTGKGSTRRLVLDLWFVADELHGTWAAPNDKHTDENKIGDSWGLVQGREGAGEPLVLDNGANTPCMICARAFFNCDTGFFDEPGCNAADSSWSACEKKLERARAAGAELPRGCGD